MRHEGALAGSGERRNLQVEHRQQDAVPVARKWAAMMPPPAAPRRGGARTHDPDSANKHSLPQRFRARPCSTAVWRAG
jgi:hypothetical protein